MDSVRIQTTQNVRIEYQLAGIGDRLIASIIDQAMRWAYVLLIFMLFSSFLFSGDVSVIVIIILALPFFLYSLILENMFDGQTIGKRIMGLKVIQADGAQCTFTPYFLRWLLFHVDVYFSSVGLLFIILSKKSQRLGDMAAGTVVIKLHRNTYLKNTVFVKLEEDYQPKYPQVIMLNDRDIQIIRNTYNQGMADYNRELIILLDAKIRQVLSIVTDEKPSAFIVSVVKDYNYYLTQRYANSSTAVKEREGLL